MYRCQPVFGGQHIEITDDDAHDQVLLRRLVINFCLRCFFPRLLQANELVPAKQGLAKFCIPAEAIEIGISVHGVKSDNVAGTVLNRLLLETGIGTLVPAAARIDLRKQRSTSLWHRFQGRHAPCVRLVYQRITLQGLLVDLQ